MRRKLNRPRHMICASPLTPAWLLVVTLGPVHAHAQTGACCLGDGVCVVTDSSGCSVLTGEFLGPGTSCATAVCTGACCLALPDNQGPGCSENLSRNTCLSSSGALSFQGAGTTCDLNCPSRLGTGFTYKGQLKQDGAPLTGTVDLEFSLWTTAEGGDQVGPTQTLSEVDVANGLFTVVLDFGTQAFAGNSRYLEAAVRAPHDPTDTAPFVSLGGRQGLTATPYAMYALSAPNGHALDAADGSPTDVVFVNNAGNVGIGTTAPAFPLHLSSTAQIVQRIVSPHTAGTWLDLENTSSGGKRWGLISTGQSNGEGPGKMLLRAITDGRSVMTLQGDGNVGVGVSSPGARLDVADTARITNPTTTGARLRLRGQAGGLNLALGAVDFVDANDVVQGSVGYTRSILGDRLILSAGQADRMAIDQDGNVGIGTTNPLDELHVRGDQATLRLEDDDDPDSFTLLNDAQPTQLRISKSNSGGSVFLDLNPKPLDSVSTGQVRLFRETNTTGAKGLSLHRGSNTAELSASIGVDGADSFFQMHGGYVGIGTSTPYAPLDVRGACDGDAATAIFAQNDCGAGVAGRTTSGVGKGIWGEATATDGINYAVYGVSDSPIGFDFYAAGAGINYGSSSSIRWKCNLESIEDPLQKLLRLRGVYFDWDQGHGGHHDVGMIAEEVGAVLPEIVSYEENGIDAHGMDYSKLTPLLVEALRELRAEKDADIAALRNEIAELRKGLISLRRSIQREPGPFSGGTR